MIVGTDLEAVAVSTTDGTGRAVLTFDAPNVGRAWWVDRIAVFGGLAAGEVKLYRWTETPAHMIEVGGPVDSNVAHEIRPFKVPQSCQVLAVFSNAGAGNVVTVTLYGRIEGDVV